MKSNNPPYVQTSLHLPLPAHPPELKAKPYATFGELQSYIESKMEYHLQEDESLHVGISKRTLQRDFKEIRNLFGPDIEYDKQRKGYYINQSQFDNANFQRMMEAFDMFHSLNIAGDLTPFIHLEKCKPQGTENLYGVLHAIKNKFQITFAYQKFYDDAPSPRTVEPYALKEFKNRWYVLARDIHDHYNKSFALDRLTELEISKKPFAFEKTFNIEENFRYCFGIIGPNNEEPQDIVLSFDPYQGNYIKTLPLHDTQEVVVDNDEELQVRLRLCVTHDLKMELLSYGDNLKVLAPASLVEDMKAALGRAFGQYE